MTTIADTFTRADSSSSLGAASDGGSWTVSGGTFGILSNQAYLPAASGGSTLGSACVCALRDSGQAVVDLSVTVSRTATTGQAVLVFGYDPVAGTGYFLSYNGATSAQVRKFSSLGQTNVRNVFGPDPIGSGLIWRVTRDGSNLITVYANGVVQDSVTDATYTTGTWVGFGASADYATLGDTWDDFSAAATPLASHSQPRIRTPRRAAVVRASVI